MTAHHQHGAGVTEAIGALAVAGILGTFLLPIAVDQAVVVDTSSWTSGATSLWGILDLVVVFAMFLTIVAIGLRKDERI